MTKAINDATLNKAGDIYQYLIALKDCFELNDGDTLQIETNGDVVLCQDFSKSPEQPLFMGFWMGKFTTADKPVRYGENNHYTYAKQSTVIGQGVQREINIYCAIPAA